MAYFERPNTHIICIRWTGVGEQSLLYKTLFLRSGCTLLNAQSSRPFIVAANNDIKRLDCWGLTSRIKLENNVPKQCGNDTYWKAFDEVFIGALSFCSSKSIKSIQNTSWNPLNIQSRLVSLLDTDKSTFLKMTTSSSFDFFRKTVNWSTSVSDGRIISTYYLLLSELILKAVGKRT